MLPHLLFAGAVFACASVFALLEIQIEGGKGWAAGLPTWKVENRWTDLLMGSRPLTGYHFYVHVFVVLFLHLPYLLLLVEPSWIAECRLISFLILFWIAEDYLWFVFNPEFGARRFTAEDAWWHRPSWLWIMPREYWVGIPVGVSLYVVSL